jgi:6,7-dimethyl-8-ribityllumazine synthase
VVAVAVVDSKDAVVVLEVIVVGEVVVDELVAHVTRNLLHLLNRSSRASLPNPLLLKLKQPNPLSRSRP